jgi:hypothetical protein
MATNAKSTAKKSTDSGARAVAERVIEAAKKAGYTYLDATEQAGERVASLQQSVGEASRIGWVSALTGAQADVTRDLTQGYVSSSRKLIG